MDLGVEISPRARVSPETGEAAPLAFAIVPGWTADTAAAMYVYGYPLVYSLKELAGFAEGHSSLPVSAPWNRFGYARELLGPETTFVSPNNDTLYVLAALDLRPGPLILHVPDTGGRYYVLQFVDAWTNNFAYIGRRATGTAEREFVLVGPDERSVAPDGAVRSAHGRRQIVGRVQVDGSADAAACTRCRISSRCAARRARPPPACPADPRVGEALRWWRRSGSARCVPAATADAEFLALAERSG